MDVNNFVTRICLGSWLSKVRTYYMFQNTMMTSILIQYLIIKWDYAGLFELTWLLNYAFSQIWLHYSRYCLVIIIFIVPLCNISFYGTFHFSPKCKPKSLWKQTARAQVRINAQKLVQSHTWQVVVGIEKRAKLFFLTCNQTLTDADIHTCILFRW